MPCHKRKGHQVSDQVRHKQACTVTEEGWKLENNFLLERDYSICVVKTQVLISCSGSVPLFSYCSGKNLVFL